tara:strand:- start:1212 stop:2060 length:849 start_codon:yes stop_codon:yes gene_type:complete
MSDIKLGQFVRWANSNGEYAQGRVMAMEDEIATIRAFSYNGDFNAFEARESEPLKMAVDTIETYGKELRNGVDLLERRNADMRVESTGSSVRGYAAVFNSVSEDLGGFVEYIEPRAFDNVMDNDVRALFNHDFNYLLGRTSAGTLKIWTDERGLGYEAQLPDTSYAKDLAVLMERGDVTQSSFAFMVDQDRWEVDDEGNYTRYIESVSRLIDVSPVVLPAYQAATSELTEREHLIVDEATEVRSEPIVEAEVEAEVEVVEEVAEEVNLRPLIAKIRKHQSEL